MAPTAGATLVITPATPAPGDTPEPGPGSPIGLRVWLPPEFTPDVDTASGKILALQIQAYENANPGTAIEIREDDELPMLLGPELLLELAHQA